MRILHDFEQLSVLGHRTRLAILRRLMAQPATLTQLGTALNETPAHIRHHLKVLEVAGLVELALNHPLHNHLEKYYQAAAEAWLVQMALLPKIAGDADSIVLGSLDLATRRLAIEMQQAKLPVAVQLLPVNSLDGLVALRQGVCDMTTCHLVDPHSGEYNRAYVQRFFPGQNMALLQLYRREEGLIVAQGNPLQIRSLEDLLRPEIRFVNRELGSGIRVWLDEQLKRLGLPGERISGYARVALTHDAVALQVQQQQVDAGLGIASSARSLGLDFVPLFDEPYEIVLPAGRLEEESLAPFFEYLNSNAFRKVIRRLDGYLFSAQAGTPVVVQ